MPIGVIRADTNDRETDGKRREEGVILSRRPMVGDLQDVDHRRDDPPGEGPLAVRLKIPEREERDTARLASKNDA